MSKKRDTIAFSHAKVRPFSAIRWDHRAGRNICIRPKCNSARRSARETAFRILNNEPQLKRPFAFLGVRACELAAIAMQDRVLLQDKFRDPIYAQRSADKFIIAAQCTRAAATCFCESMGTGPRVTGGYDLVLTELLGRKGHRFLVKSGSVLGSEVLAELEVSPADEEDIQEMEVAVREAASRQTRRIDTDGIKELLSQNFDHPRWDNVAQRCLTCANCTMVCPTCFCTTVEDVSDITRGSC